VSEAEPETAAPDEALEEAAESAPDAEEDNPDAEPVEPIEGPQEPAQEPGEAETEPEEPQPTTAQSEKARKVRDDKLNKERERHASRIGEIYGDEAPALIPCPVCMDGGADGWIFSPEVQQLEPHQIARIRQVIGLPDYTTFHAAPDAMECPDCAGLGEVTTGSHVPGYETKSCGRCNKTGYVLVGQTSNGQAPILEVPAVTGPTVYGTETSVDPEVQHLRDRGFTVFPPMPIPQNT
jgi:hypothetical protein